MSFLAPGVHLQNLLLDLISTKEEKVSCLKTLRTVMKNLADPTKNKDPKYRQLKLSNAKVKATLSPCPSALEYMKAIGFIVVVQQDDAGLLVEEYLRLDKQIMAITDAETSLAELDHAITMIVPDGGINNNRPEIMVSRAISAPVIISSSSSVSNVNSSSTIPGHVSEKEKARHLLEKKREREVQEAKEARRKTSDQIKQDKYVRENDDNWTSQQSAACVKSGSGINTFRDKFGEN
jgi:hypothetical protein